MYILCHLYLYKASATKYDKYNNYSSKNIYDISK